MVSITVTILLPYAGSTWNDLIIADILNGIHSVLLYQGVRTLECGGRHNVRVLGVRDEYEHVCKYKRHGKGY